MAEAKFRQVTWNIPKSIYDRFCLLHKWALDVNMAKVSPSEQDFAVVMFDDAVTRGENVKRAYERDGKLIVDPYEKARDRIEVRL